MEAEPCGKIEYCYSSSYAFAARSPYSPTAPILTMTTSQPHPAQCSCPAPLCHPVHRCQVFHWFKHAAHIFLLLCSLCQLLVFPFSIVPYLLAYPMRVSWSSQSRPLSTNPFAVDKTSKSGFYASIPEVSMTESSAVSIMFGITRDPVPIQNTTTTRTRR